MEASIEFFEKSGEKWQLWAIRKGEREEIIKSAENLLIDLREEYPAAKVRVILENGHKINIRFKKETEVQKDKISEEKINTITDEEVKSKSVKTSIIKFNQNDKVTFITSQNKTLKGSIVHVKYKKVIIKDEDGIEWDIVKENIYKE